MVRAEEEGVESTGTSGTQHMLVFDQATSGNFSLPSPGAPIFQDFGKRVTKPNVFNTGTDNVV